MVCPAAPRAPAAIPVPSPAIPATAPLARRRLCVPARVEPRRRRRRAAHRSTIARGSAEECWTVGCTRCERERERERVEERMGRFIRRTYSGQWGGAFVVAVEKDS